MGTLGGAARAEEEGYYRVTFGWGHLVRWSLYNTLHQECARGYPQG